MPISRKWLIVVCIAVVVAVSVALVIAKNGSDVSAPILGASFEKTGKIKHITFIYPIAGDCCSLPLTCIEFEGDEYYQFYGILKNIAEGKAYRIVYQEQERICCKDDETFTGIKISTLNVVQVIEEISP